jgi:hypothetical protein
MEQQQTLVAAIDDFKRLRELHKLIAELPHVAEKIHNAGRRIDDFDYSAGNALMAVATLQWTTEKLIDALRHLNKIVAELEREERNKTHKSYNP